MITSPDFAVLRVAALSVDEIEEASLGAAFVAQAITLAAGPELVALSAKHEKAQRAVRRYIARMGGRATPFGLLAGTCLIGLGRDQSIELAGRSEHRVRVRTDTGVIERILRDSLGGITSAWAPVRVNATLRRSQDGYRYCRPDLTSVHVTDDPRLERLMKRRGANLLKSELLDSFSTEDIQRYIDAGIIEYSISLLEAGEEPSRVAAGLLRRAGKTRESEALLLLSKEGLREAGATLVSDLSAEWSEAAELLPVLKKNLSVNERYHLDLELSLKSGEVSSRTITSLEGVARRLEGMLDHRGNRLASFRDAFRCRYEDGEVSFLEALDFTTGVAGEWLPARSAIANYAGVDEREEAIRPGGPEAALEAMGALVNGSQSYDIEKLPLGNLCLSRSLQAALLDKAGSGFAAMFICAQQGAPLSRLARFGLGDNELASKLISWGRSAGADAEDVLTVELLHSPGGRDGNILIRPRLNDAHLALSGAGGGNFHLERLLIRLEDDRFHLRDSISGRPVVLEVNTAHHPDFSKDPLYRLLASITSTADPLMWRWGPLATLPHLPRITCGDIIVSPERWRLQGSDLKGRRLNELLKGIGDRRWVGYGQSHQQVPVDLARPAAVQDAIEHIGTSGFVDFYEMPQMESPGSVSPHGKHVTELYVPLARARSTPSAPSRPISYSPSHGRAWVYFKYFCSVLAADGVIGKAAALARQLEDRGLIHQWFFVRYPEDGDHVRVRVRLKDPQRKHEVIAAMTDLGEQAPITRAVTDRYVPEIARYGGVENLPKAEALFTADSGHIAAWLSRRPGHVLRLFQSIADIMAWVGLMWPTHDECLEFLRWRQNVSRCEVPPGHNGLGKFYRLQRKKFDSFFESYSLDADVATRLRDLAPDYEIMRSVLHMHLNRIFVVDSVRLEHVAYDCAIRKLLEYRSRPEMGSLPWERFSTHTGDVLQGARSS
ncbi:thiopeptide-type bacteriocin biosynthesis protein [Actinomadura meridiana]